MIRSTALLQRAFRHRAWERIKSSRFAQDVLVVLSGTVLAQLLMVLTSPLLTRIYRPADFGVLSAYSSVLALLVVASSLRYEVAIPLPEAEDDAAALLVLSIAVVAIISAVVATMCITVVPSVLAGSSWSRIVPYLWLLPVSVAGAGIYQALSYWAVRRKAFQSLARTKVTQATGQILTQVGIGLLTPGPVGLLVGDAIGRVGGTGALATLVVRGDRQLLKSTNWGNVRRQATRFRRFPIFSSGSALLNASTVQAPVLLLAAFYGPQVAGLFGMGQRVLSVPMSLVGTAVASVYYARFATVARDDPKQLRAVFLSLTRKLVAIGAAPAAIAALLGPWLCQTVFGSEWRVAGNYLRLTAPMLFVQFVASPLGGTLDVLERQDLHLAREITRQVLSLGALLLARIMGLDAWHAVLVFGAAATVGNLFYLWTTWFALRAVGAPDA